MLSDLKYAFRQLRKSPGFAAVAVLTLALGIGACTCVFSVVNTAILHPFPYPRLDRLVVIRESLPPKPTRHGVSPGDFADYRRQSTVFKSIAGADFSSWTIIAKDADPVRVWTEHVTANFFSTLGVRPIFGRDFSHAEMVSGRGDVAILSHRLWQSEFGGRPDIVGQTMLVQDRPTTIIGVMPPWFQANLPDPQLYTPFFDSDQANQERRWHYLPAIGRLKDGVSLAQADTEIRLIGARLAKQYPDTNKGWVSTAIPLGEDTVAYARPMLYTLLGAVAALLLIACVNIANLLLARATTRQKEIVIRTAVGATRGRIVRQFLCESLLLAGFGGAFGVLLAKWSMKLVLSISPLDLPRLGEISIDGHALFFSSALALLTGLGFGLVPALQVSRVNLSEILKDGGRGTSSGKRGMRLRNLLVISEVALALILLAGAGLLTQSFLKYQNIDYGFKTKRLFWTPIILSTKSYPEAQKQINFVSQSLDRIRRIHGLTHATMASRYLTGTDGTGFLIAGQPVDSPTAKSATLVTSILPDYLKTMGIPLVRGRNVTPQDIAGALPVVLINQELARLYFPNVDPIGQRISILTGPDMNADNDPRVLWQVVGVIGSIRDSAIDVHDPVIRPGIYLPFAQRPFHELNLWVRAAPEGPIDIRAICNAVHSVDRDVAITMLWERTVVGGGVPGLRRFSMDLAIVFSGVALLLAAIGIYGVMAFNVAQRTNEIGIRTALGAQRGDVLRMILFNGGRIVGIGILIGVAGVLATARLLGSLLFNLSAYDPVTIGAITLLLSAVAFAACWFPARRATKVDPMTALRSE